MNFFFWKRQPEITGEGFRARLNEVAGVLQRQLGDVSDDSQRDELQKELGLIEATYLNDVDRLHRHLL